MSSGVVVPLASLGYQYTARVVVGPGGEEPQLGFNAIIDTASSSLSLLACPQQRRNLSCYEGSDPGFPGSEGFPCNTIVVDGSLVTLELSNHTYSDTVGLGGQNGVVSSAEGVNFLTVTEFATQNPTLHAASLADAYMGLAPQALLSCSIQDLRPRETAFLLASNSAIMPLGIFSLDLNPPDQESSLVLGAEIYPVDWANFPPPLAEDDLTVFKADIYALSMCNVALYGTLSSSWPAIVDTGAVCLSLPAEFFDIMATWLPLVDQSCGSFGGNGVSPTPCYVRQEAAGALPWMSFRLAEDASSLHLPLGDLLLSEVDDAGNPEICLRRLETIIDPESRKPTEYSEPELYYRPVLPLIQLGTLALRSLFVSFDVTSEGRGRIGMANKPQRLPATPSVFLSGCEPALECIGSSTLDPATNECIPPPCGHYFAYSLDVESMECRLSIAWLATAGALAAGFIFLELWTEIYSRKFARRVWIGWGTPARREHAEPHLMVD
jgi:hypothetical protein